MFIFFGNHIITIFVNPRYMYLLTVLFPCSVNWKTRGLNFQFTNCEKCRMCIKDIKKIKGTGKLILKPRHLCRTTFFLIHKRQVERYTMLQILTVVEIQVSSINILQLVSCKTVLKSKKD